MVGDRASGAHARAAKHAALADPTRLLIVDALSLGDASPSELQTAFDVASNLLAHHLKVLENTGVLERVRSEADRRRSYVRLVPSSLDDLAPAPHRQAHRVLFVCTRNSARSQLAAALWRRASPIPTESAGTEPADRIDAGAMSAARRHGLPMRNSRPKLLGSVRKRGDFVITVCDTAHEQIGNREGLHWSIPDPVRLGTDEAYDAALVQLRRRVDDLAQRLVAA
jgi:protein-tyrosine-phosphatase